MTIKITSKDKQEIQDNLGVMILWQENKDNILDYPYLVLFKGSRQKTIKLPKTKLIDKNYVKNEIDKWLNSEYRNLQKTFSIMNIKGNIYYTSFGFSYICWFKEQRQFNKDITDIKNKLNGLNIKYSNEYSDAMWVYRFRVSKSIDNLNKIKELN